MSITKDVVQNVAHLSRIDLTPEELEKLSKQLQAIVDFIDTLRKVDVENVAPTSHILPVNNIFREDIPCQSLPVDKALSNAPLREGNFFGVPKVID